MVILESSNQKLDWLFCPIRKCHVQATSEERVRCALLSHMMGELGYPPSLIVVERKVSEFLGAFQEKRKIPNRRIDILCYSPSLEPLLLIECKAVALSAKVQSQVLGYNHYIGAHFVAIVNSTQVHTVAVSSWADSIVHANPLLFENRLPPYFLLQK